VAKRIEFREPAHCIPRPDETKISRCPQVPFEEISPRIQVSEVVCSFRRARDSYVLRTAITGPLIGRSGRVNRQDDHTRHDRLSRTRASRPEFRWKARDGEARLLPASSAQSSSVEGMSGGDRSSKCRSICRRGSELPDQEHCRPPKTKEQRGVSQLCRAIFRKISQGAVGNCVQPACLHVGVELPIPDFGVVFGHPGSQLLKFTKRQGPDLALHFFHAAHD